MCMSNEKKKIEMEFTKSQIEQISIQKGFKVKTVIPSRFEEVEFLGVETKPFVTALFEMNNETFNYIYSHTYNASTDKITKRNPIKL